MTSSSTALLPTLGLLEMVSFSTRIGYYSRLPRRHQGHKSLMTKGPGDVALETHNCIVTHGDNVFSPQGTSIHCQGQGW